MVRTQVVIIGGGPAGLLLSQLLDLNGVDSVVLERRSEEYVMSRIRAGVLEAGSTELLRSAEVGERMDRDGDPHQGVGMAFAGRRIRIDFEALADSYVMVYGQTQIQKDLYDVRHGRSAVIIDEAEDVTPHNVEEDTPWVTYRKDGVEQRIDCDFVAGCDGSHGVSISVIPKSILKTYERIYPFGWIGVLSETPPVDSELIYANHERGFALCSMRHSMLSRYYIQADADADLDEWPDDRFWAELKARLPEEVAERLVTGPSIEKSLTPLRSFVAEPMRFGRLFLAGDAAHIVPPTGAKGLNLAISDVHYLSRALVAWYERGSMDALDAYSDDALARVWKAVRFSWWMTTLMHRLDDAGEFGYRVQLAELDYLAESLAARRSMAENYVGLPY